MKNSKLAKTLLVVVMIMMLGAVGTKVFAADENYDKTLEDMLNETTPETPAQKAPETPAQKTPETPAQKTPETPETPSKTPTLNTNEISKEENNNKKANETALPKTGAENPTGMIVLITICGISTVYAFKKIREYKSL